MLRMIILSLLSAFQLFFFPSPWTRKQTSPSQTDDILGPILTAAKQASQQTALLIRGPVAKTSFSVCPAGPLRIEIAHHDIHSRMLARSNKTWPFSI